MTTKAREYGVGTTVTFPLYEYDDGKDMRTNATHASGDTKIMKDEGAWANTTNGFVSESDGMYSLALTATEMQCARLTLKIVDQDATKLWLDQIVEIETFGHASAQFPDDYNDIADAILKRDVDQVEGSAPDHSLTGLILKGVSRIAFDDVANTLTVYRTDGTTVFFTQATVQGVVVPLTEYGVAT